MSAKDTHPLRSSVTPWLFALGPLALGAIAAQIGLSIPPGPSPWRYPDRWPPLWIFWAVWFVIYPCWGYATYLLWSKRNEVDVRGALALFAVMMISNVFFMPIAGLSGNNPGVMTMGDLKGIFTSWIVAWTYTRYDRRALRLLLPLLVWMPTTTALKVYYWASNV